MPDTPADEIRAAAGRLRNLATDATPGPWYSHAAPPRTWGATPAEPELLGGGKPIAVLNSEYNGALNAAYVAAMDPTVGLVLADWLDQAAHAYDAAVYAANEVYADDPAGRDAFLTTGPGAPSPHALRIARAINQETT